MGIRRWLLAMSVAAALRPAANAATLAVPADANIYGAGHAVPPDPAGFGPGNLPPSFGFAPGPGQALTFSGVTGCVAMTVSMGGCNGGDGSTLHVIPTGVTSYDGISGIAHDTNGFLIGVFLDDTERVDPAPASLDFRAGALGTAFPSLSPVLGQTFFVGDGLTGDGSGAVQVFDVPPTATRLFLGFADGYSYSGPPGAYADNGGSLDATFEITGGCGALITAFPSDATICAGGTATLDSSGVNLTGCSGTVLRDWSDGTSSVGRSVTVDVSPATTMSYVVTVTCDVNPSCNTSAAATVYVEEPPDLPTPTARDLLSCNLGIELEWPPAIFHDATASGTYAVHRSLISCADALARPPIATCLTVTRWLDSGTVDGATYFYVLVAEDARSPTVCADRGPCNAGAATAACLPPVTEVSSTVLPLGACAVLRASHDADDVTMEWPLLRTLATSEHVHLLHAASPSGPWLLVNGEGDRGLSFVHVDTTLPLQFFDLRVANACEAESLPEYPPPGWDDATRPCP